MRYRHTHNARWPLWGEGYTLTDLGYRPKSTTTRGKLPPTSGAETGLRPVYSRSRDGRTTEILRAILRLRPKKRVFLWLRIKTSIARPSRDRLSLGLYPRQQYIKMQTCTCTCRVCCATNYLFAFIPQKTLFVGKQFATAHTSFHHLIS